MFKLNPMSAPHPGAPHPHGSVPIASFAEGGLPPATETPEEILKRKFFLKAVLVAILQILALIIATILYYSGSEPAAIVVLCGGYFSRYFLILLAGFIQTGPPNADIEVRFALLQQKFTAVKFLLIMQLICIYLQREIVPDLWVFGVSYVMFLIMTFFVIKEVWKLYKNDDIIIFRYFIPLMICILVVFITQTVYFVFLSIANANAKVVQSKLPMGTLFVPIFFGQIANIVMIIMTKNWEVAAVSVSDV